MPMITPPVLKDSPKKSIEGEMVDIRKSSVNIMNDKSVIAIESEKDKTTPDNLTKTKKKRGLTMKEENFIQKMRENGYNATKAVQEVYNLGSYHNANTYAGEVLQREDVRERLIATMKADGIDESFISTSLKKAITSGLGVKAKNSDSIKALSQLAKLMDLEAPKRSLKASLNLRGKIDNSNLSIEQLREVLRQETIITQALLSEIDKE